jgi:hypothetical protein
MFYFMEIHPVGPELFNAGEQTNGQTEMKLVVAFRNSADATKKHFASKAVPLVGNSFGTL